MSGAIAGGGGVPGGSNSYAPGGGGGGGGDGVFANSGIVLTTASAAVIRGGSGGGGGSDTPGYPGCTSGAGGGGGNGVEFAGSGTLANSGGIYGGSGGAYGAGNYGPPGGSGGGHGVVGAGLTITNSGSIGAGAAGSLSKYGTPGPAGTAGDAILFTGGTNTLNLLTGSTITGSIELAIGASASIQPQNSGLTLSSNVVLDSSTSSVSVDTSLAGLTISGYFSSVTPGVGTVSLSGSDNNRLILTSPKNNLFSGGINVNSGDLQVDGKIGNLTISGGVLSGVGTVGIITANGGSVSPGEASTMFGTLNSSGTVDLVAGSTLAIRSTDGVTCSALNATGALTVAGSLSIHFENAPKIGATCTVATGSSVSGTFASVASAPATVTVTYNTNNVQITVTASDDIFADGFDGGVR